MILQERKDRPTSLEGQTERVETGHGHLYVTVNWDNSDGIPFEVFATLGKSGSCDHAYIEGITRLVSICLQYKIPVTEITKQLRMINCHPFLLGNDEVGNTSPVDAIGHMLENSYEGRKEGLEGQENNESV